MLAAVLAQADREALSGRFAVHPQHVRLVAEQLQVHELGLLLHELQGMLIRMLVPAEPLAEERLRRVGLWMQAGFAFLIIIVAHRMLAVLMTITTSPCSLSASENCDGQRYQYRNYSGPIT